jgi:hypothetical protein
VSVDWVWRFWENDTGKRAVWIKAIAAAELVDKQTIREMAAEQLRFSELYQDPPTVHLAIFSWNTPPMAAVKELLKSFYAPLFYKDEGFQNPEGETFHKDHFISGFAPPVRICPYTDNYIQDTKLDHFLPKDRFPMLSCHPDNLIPCSTDANSGSHKGTQIPLDYDEDDQAGAWFHPHWRSAVGTYQLTFPAGAAEQLSVVFEAIEPYNQLRLDNMARMFGLSEFWGGFLKSEVQGVAGIVDALLKYDHKPPSEENVRNYLLQQAQQARSRIGNDGLAIAKYFFYKHIADTSVLLDQVLRTCLKGS